MDDSSRALGVGTTVEIRGTTYILSRITHGMLGLVKDALLQLRTSPIAAAKELLDAGVLSPAERKGLIDDVLKMARDAAIVKNEELEAYLETPEGAVFTFWLAIRKNHPLSLEQVKEVLDDLTGPEVLKITKALQRAQGFDDLGN